MAVLAGAWSPSVFLVLGALVILCPTVVVLADSLSKPYETQSTRSDKANVAACLFMAITFALAARTPHSMVSLSLTLVFIATLILLALIDARLKVLPNKVTLPLLAAGLAFSFTGYTIAWPHALLGAVTGFLMLYLPEVLYTRLTGRRGVGFGDIKLMAAVGAWIGWQFLLHILVVAGLSAAIFGLIYLKVKRLDKSSTIPFGPFLALASILFTVLSPAL